VQDYEYYLFKFVNYGSRFDWLTCRIKT